MSTENITEVVKEKYGQAALRVTTGGGQCLLRLGAVERLGLRRSRSPATCTTPAQTGALPEDAVKASLGCGNPTALAQLNAGETVLDLGSGGGIDVLLSARRVGPTGKAYGLDMTDEMLALAQREQAQGRRRECRVPERADREHSAARQLGGRHHLELRHQSVGGQGPRAARRRSAC